MVSRCHLAVDPIHRRSSDRKIKIRGVVLHHHPEILFDLLHSRPRLTVKPNGLPNRCSGPRRDSDLSFVIELHPLSPVRELPHRATPYPSSACRLFCSPAWSLVFDESCPPESG